MTKVFSPASIGKAYLRAMGVSPILERQLDFPREALGAAMLAYYGGRAECRIRRDSKQWRAYEATDGVRSQAEVAAASSLSQPAISTLWAKWRRQGIVVERGRRPAHLASPSDLGIEIPGEDNARVGESAG